MLPGIKPFDTDLKELTAVQASRKTTIFVPANGLNSFSPTGNNIMLINLSGVDWIDPTQMNLEFDMTLSATAGAYDPVASTYTGGVLGPNSVESFFNRLTVRVGGSQVEQILNYNILETALNQVLMTKTSVDTYAPSCYNLTNDLNDRFTPFSSTTGVFQKGGYNGRRFSVGLNGSGLFGSNPDYVPLGFLAAKNNVQIEILLEQVDQLFQVIAADGGAAIALSGLTYTLSNVRLVVDYLESPEVSSAWANRLAAGEIIPYPISRWTTQQVSLPTGQAGTFNWNFSVSASDVTGVMFAFVAQANSSAVLAGTTSTFSSKTDTLCFPQNLSQYFLSVGATNYPLNPAIITYSKDWVTTTGQGTLSSTSLGTYSAPFSYQEVLKMFHLPITYGTNLTTDRFERNRFPVLTQAAGTAGTPTRVLPPTDDDGSSCFLLCCNLDSDLMQENVAGTGVNAIVPSNLQFRLQLIFSAPIVAYSAGTPGSVGTGVYGGPYTIYAFIKTRDNILISNDTVVVTSDLVDPATLNA